MEDKPKRRRLRFSIRTMLLVTAALCWLTYQLNWINERKKALARPGVHKFNGNWPEKPPRAPGMLWLFGVSGCQQITIPASDWSDDKAAELRRLFPEAEVGS